MTTSNHNSRWLLIALPLLSVFAGCWCQAFPLPGEGHCPTDARRIYCGAGEEAVRRCPCGPDRDFYGHKPTEWRAWPAGWRCGQYPYYPQAIEGPVVEQPSAGPTAPPEVANPFRNDGGVIAAPPSVRMNAFEPNEIDFGAPPTEPTKAPRSQPELVEAPPLEAPPAPAPPAKEKQDWRSAADVINSAAPVVPPANSEPPTPGDELNPPIPPGVAPEKEDATKGTSNIDLLPNLISAQNAAATSPAAATTAGPPASVSGNKSPIEFVRREPDRSPVNRRVADHLTHNLFN